MDFNQFKIDVLSIFKPIGRGIKKVASAFSYEIKASDETCGIAPIIALAIILGMGKGKSAIGFLNKIKKDFKIQFEIQEGKGDEVTIIAFNPKNGLSIRETRIKGADISFASKRNIYIGLGLDPKKMKSYCK